MAIDPICGMDVDEKIARKKGLVTTKKDKKYYFCNQSCKDKFERGIDNLKKDKVIKSGESESSSKGLRDTNEKWYESETFGKVFPWFLAVVLIGGAIWAWVGKFMVLYMGIFFIIFSLMKMPDWKGFVKAFSKYDLIAKRIKFYGWIYPGIEFGLGILYLTKTIIPVAAWTTVFVMGIGAIGVGKNLLSKNQVKCACLGTKINVPLTKVTFLEDIIMVVMAIGLIIG